MNRGLEHASQVRIYADGLQITHLSYFQGNQDYTGKLNISKYKARKKRDSQVQSAALPFKGFHIDKSTSAGVVQPVGA